MTPLLLPQAVYGESQVVGFMVKSLPNISLCGHFELFVICTTFWRKLLWVFEVKNVLFKSDTTKY